MRVQGGLRAGGRWLGWILIVAALAMRLGVAEGRVIAATALVGCGAVLAWFAWDGAAASGVTRWESARPPLGIGGLGPPISIRVIGGGGELFLTVIVLLAVAVIVLVLRAHRALRAPS